MEAHMTTAARVTRALLAASCGLLLLAAAARADTYVVDADGTGDFPTIQDAIDAASDTDVVELLDGTYTGDGNRDIDFHGKAITVRSQSDDPLSCVIDCEGTALEPHRGFHFHTLETSASVVRGVTVTNGRIHHTGDLDGGGAVICYTASPRFENCVLTGNSVTADPGGMFIRGGGVALYGLSTPAFVDCTISDNSTSGGQSYGSGIFAYLSAEVTLENCVIEGNGGATFGGGLYGYYSSVYATDCTFSGNGAVNGAGVFLGTPETAYSFVGCKFAGNHANNGGGAYCVHTASFDNCTFAMNEGTIYAGGVYCGGSIVDVSLENTVVAFSTSGEGVYADGCRRQLLRRPAVLRRLLGRPAAVLELAVSPGWQRLRSSHRRRRHGLRRLRQPRPGDQLGRRQGHVPVGRVAPAAGRGPPRPPGFLCLTPRGVSGTMLVAGFVSLRAPRLGGPGAAPG